MTDDAPLKLTWEEIAERSARPFGSSTTVGVVCFDCHLFSKAYNVPCLRHTREDERKARARAIGVTR